MFSKAFPIPCRCGLFFRTQDHLELHQTNVCQFSQLQKQVIEGTEPSTKKIKPSISMELSQSNPGLIIPSERKLFFSICSLMVDPSLDHRPDNIMDRIPPAKRQIAQELSRWQFNTFLFNLSLNLI